MDRKLVIYWLPLVILLTSASTGLFIPFIQITFAQGIATLHGVGSSATNVFLIITFFIIISPVYFFAAPLLGSFSDYFGRKKLLIMSVIFSAIGYFLGYLSTIINALSLTIFGIFIANIGYATFSIVLAGISDVAHGKRQLFAYSLAGLATVMSIGFSILGFYIINLSTGSVKHLGLISLGASGIQLLNIVLLLTFMRETKPSQQRHILDVLQLLPAACIDILAKKANRNLFLLVLVLQFSWGIFLQGIPIFLSGLSKQPEQYNTAFITYAIFLMSLGYLFILPWCFTKFNVYLTLLGSSVLIGAGIISALFSFQTHGEWFAVIPIAIGMALSIPLILTVFSKIVFSEYCGLAMGLLNTGQLLIWVVGAMLVNLTAKTEPRVPLIVATTIITLTIIQLSRKWFKDSIANVQRLKANKNVS